MRCRQYTLMPPAARDGFVFADEAQLNVQPIRFLGNDRTDGEAQFQELVAMWVEGADYSPEYDSAIRDWARRSLRR